MKPRKTTVLESTMGLTVNSPQGKASELRLRGQWLKLWGFHPGMSVQVSHVAPGRIELTVNSPATIDAGSWNTFSREVLAQFAKAGV
jgi:hypothetical protein